MVKKEAMHRFDTYDIGVEWKNVKYIYIKIDLNGNIRCVLPRAITLKQLDTFLEKKRYWIEQHANKRRETMHELHYVDGEKHQFLGNTYVLQLLYTSGKREVHLDNNQMIISIRKADDQAMRQQVLEKWYRMQMQKRLPDWVKACEELTRQDASQWRIKKMKSRWGSCNITKRRIWLNLALIKHPENVIQYVMIHELTHFYERYHNRRFKAYLATFCPNYIQLNRLLNHR